MQAGAVFGNPLFTFVMLTIIFIAITFGIDPICRRYIKRMYRARGENHTLPERAVSGTYPNKEPELKVFLTQFPGISRSKSRSTYNCNTDN